MLRISRLADYAILIICVMYCDNDIIWSANIVSQKTNLPKATVMKILKLLSKSSILLSVRGMKGGYKLSKNIADLTVLDIVSSIDGNVNFNICVDNDNNICDRSADCCAKNGWLKLNKMIMNQLQAFKVQDFLN